MMQTRICNYPGGCTRNALDNAGACAKRGGRRQAVRKSCCHEGCKKQAQSQGVCVEHGAKIKHCSCEGCVNQVVKGGACKSHWPPHEAGR
jgi:hypothetical protein